MNNKIIKTMLASAKIGTIYFAKSLSNPPFASETAFLFNTTGMAINKMPSKPKINCILNKNTMPIMAPTNKTIDKIEKIIDFMLILSPV